MLKIGITGQKGFVGYHLYNTLKLTPNEFSCIEYDTSFFSIDAQLDTFVAQCDVVIDKIPHKHITCRHGYHGLEYDLFCRR